MNIILNVTVGQPVEEVIAYAEQLRAALSTASITPANKPVAASSIKRVAGPLESAYLAESGKNHMRRTEGRTYEEMGEYNLRTYHGFTDINIECVKSGLPVVKTAPISVPEHPVPVIATGVVSTESAPEEAPEVVYVSDEAEVAKAGF